MVGDEEIPCVLGNREALFVRDPLDRYLTPPSIVRLIVIEFLACISPIPDIWEPCAGDGRIADEISLIVSPGNLNIIQTDIEMGHDFFSYDRALAPNLITNPPFRHIRKFIDHAFHIGVEKMAIVSSERLWACKKGREQFERHRPSMFCMMDFREDYLNKGGSPDRALAVNIWERPHSETCELRILHK
jgi:hypothetical protein